MCTSIIFAGRLKEGAAGDFLDKVDELGRKYNYGIAKGIEALLPAAQGGITGVMRSLPAIFEVHDMQEVHCACDIDEDIRTAAKLGRQSRFFDFCREILACPGLEALSVLFFQEILPSDDNVRRQQGPWAEFVTLLNRWHTWQVEGFEPNRGAYLIADESPLLYSFRK